MKPTTRQLEGTPHRHGRIILCLALALCGLGKANALVAQDGPPDPVPPPALDAADAPVPPNLGDFVADGKAAIALGKALFWDMQAGGDGKTACASCHYHAGADNRVKNTVGLPKFGAGVRLRGANLGLTASDFPFHRLQDPNQPASDTNPVLFDTPEVVGSQGVVRKTFLSVRPAPEDYGKEVSDPLFSTGGANCRRVTGRNAPSVINAVFNDRNFWDGRANRFFNGVNPFGDMDPGARVWKYQNGRKFAVAILLDNSSLASQAVGPPNNSVEMSWDGRSFPDLGRKLLTLRPLALQRVHPNDSVLGPMANPNGPGLAPQFTYGAMIQRAFRPEWWSAPAQARFPVGLYSYFQSEINFSLFWGLAIQAYEATLVSDDSKYDRSRRGTVTLAADEQVGMNLFMGIGNCVACHAGPEFTKASVRQVRRLPIENMFTANNQLANYDSGYYNIGSRPTAEDDGAGGTSPLGGPLSLSRRQARGEPLLYSNLIGSAPSRRTAVDGAFKTPSLRNVELTGPYMHNGGIATLADVVRFYARDPDFAQQNIDNLSPDVIGIKGVPDQVGVSGFIGPNIAPAETQRRINAVVAFMKTLTDERVRWQKAPFDHPELMLPRGHKATIPWGTGVVNPDDVIVLPAVGADGAAEPLKPFDEVLPP